MEHLKRNTTTSCKLEEVVTLGPERSKPGATWADPKMKLNRKAVQTRNRLVTHQVMVTPQVRRLMRQAVENFSFGGDLTAECFRRELVVFVPKLASIVKNVDNVDERLKSSCEEVARLSIPINCVHSDEGWPNNVAELQQELKKRQLDHDLKVIEEKEDSKEATKDAEVMVVVKKEAESKPISPDQRSLRCRRLRQNYEETTVDDEELFTTYVRPSGKVLPPSPQPPPPPPPLEENDEASDEDEDTYGQHFLAKGRERARCTDAEVQILEEHFERNPYPKRRERRAISQLLRLPAKKVRIWFQNKRNKTEDGKMKCFFVRNNIAADGTVLAGGKEEEVRVKRRRVDQEEEVEEEEENSQFCRPCCKAFSTRWNYKVHRRKFHKEGHVAPVKCKECGKSFDTKWNLKTHLIELHGKLTGKLP